MYRNKVISREDLPRKYRGKPNELFAVGGIGSTVLYIFPDDGFSMDEAMKLPGLQFCYVFVGGNQKLINSINSKVGEPIKVNSRIRVKTISEKIRDIEDIMEDGRQQF